MTDLAVERAYARGRRDQREVDVKIAESLCWETCSEFVIDKDLDVRAHNFVCEEIAKAIRGGAMFIVMLFVLNLCICSKFVVDHNWAWALIYAGAALAQFGCFIASRSPTFLMR